MSLKAPGILTFTLSVVIVVIAAVSKYAHASIPFINGNEFALLLFAHILLVFGCVMRGL